MNEPMDRFDVDSLDADVIAGPDVSTSEARPAPGVKIPCRSSGWSSAQFSSQAALRRRSPSRSPHRLRRKLES